MNNNNEQKPEQKNRKRGSLKPSHPYADPNELMKLQKKRNSVNWLLPQGSSFQFKEIKTSFQDIESKPKGLAFNENNSNQEILHKKFEENRRQSIKNEFQIAKELLMKQSQEIKEELEENEVIEKNTELNKEVGKENPDEDDDSDKRSSSSSNSKE